MNLHHSWSSVSFHFHSRILSAPGQPWNSMVRQLFLIWFWRLALIFYQCFTTVNWVSVGEESYKYLIIQCFINITKNVHQKTAWHHHNKFKSSYFLLDKSYKKKVEERNESGTKKIGGNIILPSPAYLEARCPSHDSWSPGHTWWYDKLIKFCFFFSQKS